MMLQLGQPLHPEPSRIFELRTAITTQKEVSWSYWQCPLDVCMLLSMLTVWWAVDFAGPYRRNPESKNSRTGKCQDLPVFQRLFFFNGFKEIQHQKVGTNYQQATMVQK
jgi:hypothetical protein